MIDFFALKGARLLAASVMSRAIEDTRSKRKDEREWAINWVNYQANTRNPDRSGGLRFTDCLDVLGLSSRTAAYRALVFSEPDRLLVELNRMCKQLRETRGDVLDAEEVVPLVGIRPGGLFQAFPSASMNTGRPTLSEFDADRSLA